MDLYADENKPETCYWSKVFQVKIPHEMHRRTADTGTVYVEVDKYGWINIDTGVSHWFGKDLKNYAHQREIFDWLVEWELAEWKQIGPEDRELFATEKLTGEKNENNDQV